MKNTSKTNYTILALILVLIIAILFSCNNAQSSGHKKPRFTIMRATVLENNTITYVTLSPQEQIVYKPHDSVWINLNTHKIDDTSLNTMKAVLYKEYNDIP